ncbi:hypothetical protein AMATHDRAFT_134638 [Amanita thiersii Skay4041]|uniref:UreD-domain-containing protein n=1 Tax=Amanita thiersii Skay4041 TaxID=703135 RepID=A0A2A9NUW7_9AGAR|nr:hypothetical protein AMATHDRAFT_134638 [Amanita thiersii Skay4041]
MLGAYQSHAIVPKIPAGSGRIVLNAHGPNVVFSQLSSAYPLKLLSSRTPHDKIGVVYVLTYGGGLVGGDKLNLNINVKDGGILVLLSQGSTKVFKSRPEQRLASVARPINDFPEIASPAVTAHLLDVNVATDSILLVLMDPVTCFRGASYSQVQTFRLEDDQTSLLVLDWLTSGRKMLGEEWAFSRYYSSNEIWVANKRVMRDVMLLEEDDVKQVPHDPPPRSLAEKLAPYACYATVFFYGPRMRETIASLNGEYETIRVFKTQAPQELLWSMSPIAAADGLGAVLRVAAIETELVKKWLSNALRGLEDVISKDVYRRAFT